MALIIILLLTVIIPDTYIKGRIFDEQKQPVSGVDVHILNSNYFTSSDQDGFFLINTNNASDLEVKWVYSTGGTTNAQGTPIYHDGMLFLAQNNSVHAINATTGKRAWIYDHDLPEDFGGQFNPFFTGKHKGVSIYGKNIYFLANECTIVALDYKTGDVKFSYKIDRPYPRDFETTADGNGYFCTAPATVIPGKLLVPMNATDTGGLQGYVHAHSTDTGERLWAAMGCVFRQCKPVLPEFLCRRRRN